MEISINVHLSDDQQDLEFVTRDIDTAIEWLGKVERLQAKEIKND